MIVHLVVSTLILGAAMLAARLLPLTARTRHALLLCGLAKFALPSEPFAQLFALARVEPPLPLRVLGGGTAAIAAAAPPSTDWVIVVWAVVAIALFGRWLLLRTRTIRAAKRVAQPASARERGALTRAMKAIDVHVAVDVIRSSVFEAPAVLHIVRPTIVLPHRDDLDDDELHALLCHECAHIARRDNLTSLLAAIAGAALWFHPLVWLALRNLGTAREEACDERVAEATGLGETYLRALAQICSSAIAPRPAGVSCMASAHLKERMEHLMSYDRLKKSAWSHRGVVVAAILATLTITTVVAAPVKNEARYRMTYSVRPLSSGAAYDVRIFEVATGKDLATASLTTTNGTDATIGNSEAGIAVRIRQDGEVVVEKGDVSVERVEAKWTGKPISMDLKDADVRDVLKTFGKMTNLKVEINDDVNGQVTIDLKGIPWDQALDMIARRSGLELEIVGKVIRVSKAR